MTYEEFLERKAQCGTDSGFAPTWMPDALFDFQQALVEWAVRKGRAAIFADCGLGKGQPADARVLTPTGWKPIGGLVVGDLVIASNGRPARVKGVYPKPEQDTYRIHFSDKASFVVDGEHLHICRTNNDRQRGKPWRVMSTHELLTCGNLRYAADRKSRNYDIPVVADVEFAASALPVAPYVLGALLGDGHLKGNVSLSSADEELVEDVRRRLPSGVTLHRKAKYDWKIKTGLTGTRRHPFRDTLAKLGLLGKLSAAKFVPREYLFASPADRLEMLRGLMDTDGFIGPGGTCQFYSVSPQLATDVIHLVRSLGGVPTSSRKATACDGKPGQACHVVTFSLSTHNPFRLTRKAARWNPEPRDNGRWIDRIEFEKRQPTTCIAVDSTDSSYVTEHFIVTHNTPMQLVWAENVVRQTNRPVLIATPLAVSPQVLQEAEKFGVEAVRSRDGSVPSGARVVVTNYERVEKFNPADFAGMVCDESSLLKNFDGARKALVTEFMRTLPYRLLCTATAAPNDYVELGTSSEALGGLGHADMLSRFFKNDQNNSSHRTKHMTRWNHREPGSIWRFKGHAETPFWRWVCSWARAIRKPSDLGFSDERFVLPPLEEIEHVVKVATPRERLLFDLPAVGLREQREERRRSIKERCEMVASLVDTSEQALVWCHLNDEGDLLEELIPDAIQVAGSDSDDAKEDRLLAFARGEVRVLVTKPKIGAWGLNLQRCAHVTFFPSHSYEQFYQGVRRVYRFGQARPVRVDVVATEGEQGVLANLRRKAEQADRMFSALVEHMNAAVRIARPVAFANPMEQPGWLSKISV